MIYQLNPICDRRWERFVERHPRSSVFHRREWLEALWRTYGYEPVAYTMSGPQEELTNAVVFCRVTSWLTGRRLVSLPFSDHCDPLLGGDDAAITLLEELRNEQKRQKFSHVEFRPRNEFPGLPSGAQPSESYCFHAIDLQRDEKAIYSGFHKDCIQRKIKRADKEKLEYAEGRSAALLRLFYNLFVQTRQRQGVPPQPFRWFQNLAEGLGPAMQVRVALSGGRAAAAIVTLQHQKTLVYKYGCSDTALNKLGGTPWLFWKTIRDAKEQGLRELDLGRSSWHNPGLIAFKDRLGGTRTPLNYWKYPPAAPRTGVLGALKGPAGWVLGHSPQPVLVVAGRVLYRHFG